MSAHRKFPLAVVLFLAAVAGLVALTLRPTGVAGAPPPNDNFADATDTAPSPFTASLSTTEATNEVAEAQPCGNIGKTVWFEYTPAFDGVVVADTAGSGFDTVLAVYEYVYSSPPLGIGNLACNDDAGLTDMTSSIEIPVLGGSTYFFQVGGRHGASGAAQFHLSYHPANDDINDARGVYSLPFTAELPTDGATSEPGETQPCGAIGKAVWFRYRAPGNFAVTVNTAGSDFDTVLAAYTAGPTSPPLSLINLGCSDDVSQADATSSLVGLQLQTGKEYFFQAGGQAGASGNLVFNIIGPPPGSISGIVTDGVGAPIAGAYVYADSDWCCVYGNAVSSADGSYVVTGLLPAGYRVFAEKGGSFVGEYYPGTYDAGAATIVQVVSAVNTPDINFALGPGGSITGTVTDQETGLPIAGASVQAESEPCCFGYGSATTAPDGSYTIATLAPVAYRVYAWSSGYAQKYFDKTYDYSAATLVGVSEGAPAGGVHFALDALNTDGDACTDPQETAPDPLFGGDRNPLDPWDFYDVNGTKSITLSDTLLILEHFGHAYNGDTLDPLLDRYVPDSLKPWRTAEALNGITLADALANLLSFGHSCAPSP